MSDDRAPPQAASDGASIFEECAEIALEHVGEAGRDCYPDAFGYDKACRDIAAAIKTRASNRKVMDALVSAADAGFDGEASKYEFAGTKTEQIKQIGNAVSVALMKAEVKAIMADAARPARKTETGSEARRAAS